MKFSRDSAIPRIPAPHLLKQGQLQLAGASFRDESGDGTTGQGAGQLAQLKPVKGGRDQGPSTAKENK